MPAPTFAPGALVRARQREWVVLPDSEPDLLLLRPLGGTDDEVTGIDLLLEDVQHAQFGLPDPNDAGDYRSARLLFDALRLGFRASAGPFRSFARLAVEPRPYQLVPLLLALRQHPAVRLLLADDVGIGKTIEAGLIAAELLARHEARGLTVLCPPHLAEQWQRELAEKFHLSAALVLPSTVRGLERSLGPAESIFTAHPITVVSMDYIKSERHRDEFIRACPDLVIVDEAHTVALAGDPRSAQHRRHDLIRALSQDPSRHLILVTATPHSGKSDAFRSLLALLDRRWVDLPDDLSGPEKAPLRRDLARYLVQRRREDIRHYAREDTPFPEREVSELTYDLTPAYAALFDAVLDYARERLTAPDAQGRTFRVRWWAALGLLRALASSPAAAAATLRTRAMALDAESSEAVDELGRALLLDREEDDATLYSDHPYGADTEAEPSDRARLNALAKRADALSGAQDAKLARALTLVKRLVEDGFQPIVFCRFVATAEYLADALRSHLRGTEVVAVTGLLPAAEREARVHAMAEHPKRVLVATDCLSEGINLQEHFNAVVHYDLAWNPTRHEQREGRVDRYGQPRDAVKVVTLYGRDNKIDGIVLDVLLRKHQQIRKDLGVSVPIPAGSEALLEAVFEGLVLRGERVSSSQMLLFDSLTAQSPKALHLEWDRASDREKRSRTLFAQDGMKTEDVMRELHALRHAMGGAPDVERFVREAVRLHGGSVEGTSPARIHTQALPYPLRETTGWAATDAVNVRFGLAGPREVPYLARTHPAVEGLATYVLDTALDGEGLGRRAGVMRTPAVSRRTTLLLLRFRFHLVSTTKTDEKALLAEEAGLMAFEGSPEEPRWLPEEEAAKLLNVPPSTNVHPDQTRDFLAKVTDAFHALTPALEAEAQRRGLALLDAHRRVRDAAQTTGRYRVQPHLPVDVLGLYVLLPAPTL